MEQSKNAYEPADSIQGNILKSFAREQAAYLMLRFRGKVTPEGRVRLSEVLRKYVTSAARQGQLTERWKETGESAGVGMFGLSHSGYEQLDLLGAAPSDAALGAELFQKRLIHPQYRVGHDELWEAPYRQGVDAFLLLADDNPSRLGQTVQRARVDLESVAEVCTRESGARLYSESENIVGEVERFGFRDLMSKGPDPEIVLTPENGGSSSSRGCFAVFMKLEQDTAKFEKHTRELASIYQTLHVPVTAEDTAAGAVGRFRNGEPLALHGRDSDDFDHGSDKEGARCPLQAHTRVMNPRDGRRLVPVLRRGMSYGQSQAHGACPEAAGKQPAHGLLFLGLHRSLLDFLILMARASHLRDPILSDSSDWTETATGATHCTHGFRAQRWMIEGKEVCYAFADVTRLRGGEFFYIPSMNFIRSLGAT
jgi:deferrochelatase/peroxidase EfeB